MFTWCKALPMSIGISFFLFFWITAVSPSIEINMWGPSQLLLYWRYTSTWDPAGSFRSSSDASFARGPVWGRRPNSILLLSFSLYTASIASVISFSLRSWFVDGLCLSVLCIVPKTSSDSKRPSGPTLFLIACTAILRHVLCAISVPCYFLIILYAARNCTWYRSNIPIVPGDSTSASRSLIPVSSKLPLISVFPPKFLLSFVSVGIGRL